MAEIVNLRAVRKRRARADAALVADANRAKAGMTKAERAAIAKRAARQDAALDGAKLDTPGEEGL